MLPATFRRAQGDHVADQLQQCHPIGIPRFTALTQQTQLVRLWRSTCKTCNRHRLDRRSPANCLFVGDTTSRRQQHEHQCKAVGVSNGDNADHTVVLSNAGRDSDTSRAGPTGDFRTDTDSSSSVPASKGNAANRHARRTDDNCRTHDYRGSWIPDAYSDTNRAAAKADSDLDRLHDSSARDHFRSSGRAARLRPR